MMMMAVGNSSVLRRLRKAVQRVRFLLSTNLNHWLFVGSSSAAPCRLISFKDQAGLLDLAPSAAEDAYHHDDAAVSSSQVTGFLSRTVSSAASGIGRTISSTWSEIARSTSLISSSSSSSSPAVSRNASDASSTSSSDDINRRADAFIENFYRQLRMERQVSLQLRYCKSGSLERTKSDYS